MTRTLSFELDDCRLPLEAFSTAREFALASAPSRGRPAQSMATDSDHFRDLHGTSAPMKALYRMLEKVAPTSASVLIVGESGTGKEIIATTIHEASPRAERPFVAINCGALPANLVEAELFGYEKGCLHRGRACPPRLLRARFGRNPCSWTRSRKCPRSCRSP